MSFVGNIWNFAKTFKSLNKIWQPVYHMLLIFHTDKDKCGYFYNISCSYYKWNMSVFVSTDSCFTWEVLLNVLRVTDSFILKGQRSYPVSSMMQPSHGSGHWQSPGHTHIKHFCCQDRTAHIVFSISHHLRALLLQQRCFLSYDLTLLLPLGSIWPHSMFNVSKKKWLT